MSSQRPRIRRRAGLVAAGALALAAAIPAQAGAVLAFIPNPNPVGADFLFSGGVAERNNVVVSDFVNALGTPGFRAAEQDPAGPLLLATPPCQLDGNPRVVACAPLVTAIRGSKDVKGDLNSFDDQLTVQGTTVTVDINGGLGDDQLRGGIGPDRLDGGAGNNFISGGDGNDDLVGGVAADAIDGGRGQDSINGNAGRDTISVNDGDRDTVFCGGGILDDNVVADLQDVFPTGDCENITLTPVGLLPAVGIARLRIGGPGVTARLACPADSARPCAGKATAASVRLRGRRPPRLKTLGTARYSIAKGRSETVRITLTDAEVEALRDVGRLRITSVEPGNELGPKTVFRTEAV